jgi:hypothetical protein
MYHSKKELKEIENWSYNDYHNLINHLFDKWEYKDYFIKEWKKNRGKPLLILKISTGGWSGNEDIIDALMKTIFWDCFWSKTEKGGHYTFEVDFYTIGFKLVSEYTKEHGVSRQAIYNSKRKYEWIEVSHGIKLIRKKND